MHTWFKTAAIAVALALGLAALALIGDAAQAATTIVAKPSDMQGWAFFDDNGNGGEYGFTTGPGSPPLGSGSASLHVNATNQGVALGTAAYQGTRLDTIDTLSYSTYRTSGSSALAISLGFDVDYDVTDSDTSYQGRLTFEPYYTNTVSTGAWQTWDTLTTVGTGNWWSSRAPGNAVCPISNPCTWSEVLSNFPDAGVRNPGGVIFKAGSGWAGFEGSVDNLTIEVSGNATTYDFEAEPCTTTCYVNGATGNDSFDGASPSSAKATIQGGVGAVSPGGTVEVAAGTYTTGSQVVINKDITMNGADASTTIIGPGFDTGASGDSRGWFLVESGNTFDLSDVTLDGTGNLVWQAIRNKGQGSVSDVVFTEIKYNESGPSYSGIGIAAFGTGPVDVTGSTFSEIGRIGVLYFGSGVNGSVFSENTYTGKGPGDWLDYAVEAGAGAQVTIERNSISGNRGVASSDGSTSAGILASTFFGSGTEATISENVVTDSTAGIAVGFCSGPGTPSSACTEADSSTVTATGNDLSGNDTGVSSTAPLVNASNNWWGDNTPAGVSSSVSGPVDYSPWLDVGTDTDGATAGFQGNFSTLHVDDDSPQAAATGTIQEGIDSVNGSTVLVEPGTYDDTMNFDGENDITVDGTDKSLVTLAPTSTLAWGFSPYGSSRQAVIRVVDSTDITIQNMTMDFNAVKGDNIFGFLYWNSTGAVVDNLTQNMSIADSPSGPGHREILGYYRAPDFTDTSRAEIAITGNEFIDSGRLAIVTHGFVDATINNNTIYKTTDDFGYGMEIGSESEATVTGNTIHGYDTAAASDGSTSSGIYVENAFTASVSGVTKNVEIANNEVYDSQFALTVGNQFNGFAGDVDIVVDLHDNHFHDNVDGGTVLTDEDKENGSSVTITGGDNTIVNNGPFGHLMYTIGDGDLTVDLEGDEIGGHDVGVTAIDTAGGSSTSSYDLSVRFGEIVGNTTFGVENTISGETLDARNNWWGACDGPSGVAPGSGDAVSADVTYDPWEQGKCDNDNDLLTNDEENLIYGTDPNDPDTDKDGCRDGVELLSKAVASNGGGRDPLYFWDFYDVWTFFDGNWQRDGVVTVSDITATAARFGGGPTLSKEDALTQALVPPTDDSSYHPAYDRSGVVGANVWEQGPPDGAIALSDILAVVAQFGHGCTTLP